MNYFSKNLKYLRQLKKLSRSELASKINLNQSTIARWENEEMGANVDNAYDVAEYFNISIADLVGVDLEHSNITKNISDVKKIIKELPSSEMSEEHKTALINMVDYFHDDNKNN